MKTPVVFLTLAGFLISSIIGPMPDSALADEFHLPAPGAMVHLSPPLDPPMLKGIKVYPDNPFRFDFILDVGDGSKPSLREESTKLIKYFLASLTIPEKDLWVNLSPYEKNRIIPRSFGLTEMGRDLLGEDYMLKQITASLIYPEDQIGRKFWKRIYEEASKKFGTTNIPVNTFNKVWIVPEKAVVYENAKAGTAYVVESKLKVMLEQDYLALNKSVIARSPQGDEQLQVSVNTTEAISKRTTNNDINALGSQIVREIVIPELTKEVNEDKNFAKLRQVYNSLILATWYKKKIKDSILEQVYADKNKTAGVQYTSSVIPAKAGIQNKNDIEAIYQRYLQAFKKGVYSYIKEDIDPVTQETIPRKYFSGGAFLALYEKTNLGMTANFKITSKEALVEGILQNNTMTARRENLLDLGVFFKATNFALRAAQVKSNQTTEKYDKKDQDRAMRTNEISGALIETWNSAGIEKRAQMLVKPRNSTGHEPEPYKDHDFLMYVLLDSQYNFRRSVVEINNWGVTDEKLVQNIPFKVITDKFGFVYGARVAKWLVRNKVLKIRFLSFYVNQNIILNESGLRQFMGEDFWKVMKIFYTNKYGTRLPPEAMPVDYLLRHLERPRISTDEYGLPKLTDPNVNFDERIAWANKRMAILIMFIEGMVNREDLGRVEYGKELVKGVNAQAEHLGNWSKDIDKWFDHLRELLKSPNIKDRNILGENEQMTFWEAFCRVYVLFKWFDKKGINNPYEWFKDDLLGFRASLNPSSEVYSILEHLDKRLDEAMTSTDKVLNTRQFATLDDLLRYAGTGKVAASIEDAKSLAWLTLTDHIAVRFVGFPQRKPGSMDFLNYEEIKQEGDAPVYLYTLPQDITVGETLALINDPVKGIRSLSLSDDEKKKILAQVPEKFKQTARYLAKKYEGQMDQKREEAIKTFYALGLILGEGTTEVIEPEIFAIAHEENLVLEKDIVQWLGLDENEMGDADQLMERATSLAVQGVQIELESLSYWRGMRLFKNELKFTRFPSLNLVLEKAGLKKMVESMGSFKSLLPGKIDLDGQKNEIDAAKQRSGTNSTEAADAEIRAIKFLLGPIRKLPGWVKQKGIYQAIFESSPAIGRLTNEINCVGRSALTALYLQELGIDKVWNVNLPEHELLLVQLSDGRYFWVDPAGSPSDSRIASLPPGINTIPSQGINLNLKKELGADVVNIQPWREGMMRSFYFNLGRIQEITREYEGAIASYRKATELDPQDTRSLNNLGIVQAKTGDYEGSIVTFRRTIRLGLNISRLHYNLGIALEKVGQINDASAEYRKAIELDPKEADAYINLGIILWQTGQKKDAIKRLFKAMILNPKSTISEISKFSKKDMALLAVDWSKKHIELSNNGGIDLTAANMHLQTQNSGGEIKFKLDPAMLHQLQNAPGFMPVIINIQPMTDLRKFLGLSDPSPSPNT